MEPTLVILRVYSFLMWNYKAKKARRELLLERIHLGFGRFHSVWKITSKKVNFYNIFVSFIASSNNCSSFRLISGIQVNAFGAWINQVFGQHLLVLYCKQQLLESIHFYLVQSNHKKHSLPLQCCKMFLFWLICFMFNLLKKWCSVQIL